MQSLAVILGSAFEHSIPAKLDMKKITVDTPWGKQELFKSNGENSRTAYALLRHGMPHHLLPNQINYRAQAWALDAVNCGALVINSSVGVLDPDLPLYTPMVLTDLLMPENRLPDGSTCTMFEKPSEEQGHLILNEGLFSNELSRQLYRINPDAIHNPESGVVFVYAGGPRSKTPAENRMWARLGGQVNSMTLAPEVVLANELQIPVVGLVVGHKYSVPDIDNPGELGIRHSLEQAREATEVILTHFLQQGKPVPFGNHLYRY